MDAIYAGHSIWAFIVEKYGDNALPNVIYMAKVSRNIENGFLFVLGISYKQLIEEWIKHYEEKYSYEANNLTTPKNHILKRIKRHRTYQQFKISPEGNQAVYTANEMGKVKIYLYDIQTGKSKKIFKNGYKLDEKTDYSYPIMTWHPIPAIAR